MITGTRIYVFLLIIAFSLIQCHSNNQSIVKIQADDPFSKTIVPSQQFEINAKTDNVIEGENGTIIIFPKGCFRDKNGEVVDGNVKVELAEALSLNDMLLSNLTTTSNGNLLQSAGMIYFNAYANGEQLTIDTANPIYIEIPTAEKIPGMMAYRGERDKDGNMSWTNPKKLENYITTVDLNLLDFLPDGFKEEVDKHLTSENKSPSTNDYDDSLYYSLSANNDIHPFPRMVNTNVNEAYYSQNNKVINGREYSKESYETSKSKLVDSSVQPCGIDPAIIKVIKSDRFQNTLIATREFERRLRVIFKTCNDNVLKIYATNLDKNLYQLDSMAAASLNGNKYDTDFNDFYKEHLTNVKDANKYTRLLRDYYEQQLKKIKKELEESAKNLATTLNKKNEEAEKVVNNYIKVLKKREKYRMETYGFTWSKTGWINIDNDTVPKWWGSEALTITLQNGKDVDRAYIYVIYPSIKSLYRLNTKDNAEYYVGNDEEKQMLMPKNKTAVAIAIGYKNELPYMIKKEFETVADTKFNLELSPSSFENIKRSIEPYDNYSAENQVSKDLEYMQDLYKEQQRQKVLEKEYELMNRLRSIAYPCCSDTAHK